METGGPVPSEWKEFISEVLIGSTDLSKRINEVALSITEHYKDLNPILIVVLKGAVMFASDLSRALPFRHELEFIRAKSYEGTQTTGTVKIIGLEHVTLTERHVIVIEDIVDTGLTLRRVCKCLEGAGAASVKCCSLLVKETAQRHEGIPIVDYVAFRVPDKFVIGYGLDYDQAFRHIPFVGVYRQ